MKKKIIFAIILVMVIGLVGCDKKEQEPVQPGNDFAFKFLQLENDTKNMVYSPLSIKYALSMLNEGADGKTKEEIEAVLKDLKLPKYESIDQNLSFANAVYIRDTYKEYVIEEFTNTLKEKYDAEVKFDAFANAQNVNKFIEDKTLGIIKNMLKDEAVSNPYAEMILINALAIDMEWEDTFDFRNTSGRDFTLADGSKVNATTMHQTEIRNDAIGFYKGDDVTALSMDLKKYGDVELEFLAIMPKGSLTEYVKTVKTEDIDKIKEKLTLASATKGGLNITIPKFKFDYDLSLKADLIKLGINDAFDSKNADFTKMTNNPRGLFVSEALHKADIEFTEKGVKAAAVTVFMMYDKSSMPIDEPEEVVIDNPFLYVIRDKANGEIWFVGTVYSPNLWENDKAEYMNK